MYVYLDLVPIELGGPTHSDSHTPTSDIAHKAHRPSGDRVTASAIFAITIYTQ